MLECPAGVWRCSAATDPVQVQGQSAVELSHVYCVMCNACLLSWNTLVGNFSGSMRRIEVSSV